ncbi:glycosyltransferase family 2 protein [Hyphomicrobium sp. 99]|uniref:glycosyltransferase family 2 protein n=1 Tax=Hyphomicrobium sp. 99 TaxID=1163419 RepID=UPI0018CC8B00|nr:glycosyltransferase [Hyphomicrobium sp. 99]
MIIATSGRPDVVSKTLAILERQTVQAHEFIISCVSDSDVGAIPPHLKVKIVKGAAGLTRQRNAGLRSVSAESDIVVFFDDDFVPDFHWIEAAENYFAAHADVACLTGALIADGINGRGLTFDDALRLIESNEPSNNSLALPGYSPYGCNMAFRRSAIRSEFFDERLVLYAWQEDRDFGARVAKHGNLVKIGAAKGVHLGLKKARISGVKLGYSQVINPFYLWQKGTMSTFDVLSHVGGNMIANIVRSFRPEPYIDRIGRLRGNAIAFCDLARGRITPERAAAL